MTTRARRFFAFTSACAGAMLGCSGAPPAARITTTAPSASMPAVTPTRWVRTGGFSNPGVAWGKGRVVLLGGRRALVDGDGSLREERVPTPEPLERLAVVSTAAGPRLVGHGQHDIYVFDDPLGAPKRLAHGAIAPRVLGGFELVVLSGHLQAPRVVDLLGGARTMPGLRDPRLLSDLAFSDAQHGAAILLGGELVLTSDGGRTFLRVASAYPVSTAMSPESRLGVLDRDVLLIAAGSAQRIDFVANALGPLPGRSAERSPLLSWLQSADELTRWTWRWDPLARAVSEGVPAAGGYFVSNDIGVVARVDVTTGAVVEWVPLPGVGTPGRSIDWCSLAPGDVARWLACSDALYRVTPSPKGISVEKDDPKPPESLPVTSSTGGLGFGRRVRRADGTWWTATRIDGITRDARAARLVVPRPEEIAAGARLRVALESDGGKSEELSPLDFYPDEGPKEMARRGPVTLRGRIEEDASKTLHFVIADTAKSFVVRQPLNGKPTARAFQLAKLGGDFGVAIDRATLLLTTDAGRSWTEAAAPKGLVDELIEGVAKDPAGALTRLVAVSPAGARLGSWLRVGWGEARAPEVTPVSGGFDLTRPEPPPMRLACKTTGPAASETGWGKDEKGPEHGKRVEQTDRETSESDAVLDLDESTPASLTVRWRSKGEVRPIVHAVTAPTPADFPSNARFVLRGNGNVVDVDLERDGHVFADVAGKLDFVGRDAVPARFAISEPVAWIDGSVGRKVHVGQPGGQATIAAFFPGAGDLGLGTYIGGGLASRDGVPLVFSEHYGRLARLLPLPGGSVDDSPTPIPLDGWVDLESALASLTTLPICAPNPKGQARARIHLAYASLGGEVDGGASFQKGGTVFLELGPGPGGTRVCLAAVLQAWKLMPDDFVYADLANARAVQGLTRPMGARRPLACKLEAGK